MSEGKKQIGNCTVGCSDEIFHILILVSGTTDPVNTFTDIDHRSMSYERPKHYWDRKFYEGIQELVNSTRNAALFDLHGWSGDNRQGNREVAGAYLVNRLVGANKEKAFYGPSYRKKKIHIHLVGHSHGGNVINEMTRQISKLGSQWPDGWKVKSFTYLSTPFFQKIHQVRLGGFVHPQAEVLNVYNDYDYTQRMLADFSLFTLHDAIQVGQITEKITGSINELMASFRAVPWDLAKAGWLTEEKGRRLYTATRDLLGGKERKLGFKSVVQFLEAIENVFTSLNRSIQYKVDKGIQANNTVAQSFQLLSDSNLANLRGVIKVLVDSINLSVDELSKGIKNDSYNRASFSKALISGGLPLARNLAAFLNVPPGSAPNVAGAGVLWQTLVSVLSDAIEVFDDTVTKPNTQFNGSRPIAHLNVTARDPYHSSVQQANCRKLMARIEIMEKRAIPKPQPNLLFDLLLTLMVHNPQARDLATMFSEWAEIIDYLEYGLTGDLDATAKAIRSTMTNLSNALLSRFVGELEDSTDTHPDKEIGQRGSLPYLLKESHSTSRRVLHPEVRAFLQRMMEH